MKTTKREYAAMSKRAAPPSPILGNCLRAFLVGGAICMLGQVIVSLCVNAGMPTGDARTVASIALITLSVLLTGLNVYDDVARFAGAGTLVPITGFANSIASPAMEFKTEGYVLGLGAKMFSIAGPVLVYGTVASVLYGLIRWLIGLF